MSAVSAAIISPVIPRLLPRDSDWVAGVPGVVSMVRRSLPLPSLLTRRTTGIVYGLSAVDDRGRLADRAIMQALGWSAGLGLDIIRQWCVKFGQTYANGLRRCRPLPGDKWHLDEVFLTINGKRQYLWRAVDQDGNVLGILVTSRRDTNAATRFFRKLLKSLEYMPG